MIKDVNDYNYRLTKRSKTNAQHEVYRRYGINVDEVSACAIAKNMDSMDKCIRLEAENKALKENSDAMKNYLIGRELYKDFIK